MAKKEDKKKKKAEETPSIRVSDKLKNFDIYINSFGEIVSNYDVDKINDYLNQNIDDKKLKNRTDWDKIKDQADSEQENEQQAENPKNEQAEEDSL
jgi:hypothetical protein